MAVDPRDYLEIHEFLNKISYIAPKTWGKVAQLFTVTEFNRGDHFALSGRMEYKFGIVIDGIFRAYINTNKGSEYTKTFFTPVSFKTPICFIGAYSALVSSSVNHVNIQALTHAKVLVGDYKDWLSLAGENKEVADWKHTFAELLFVSKESREFEYTTLQAEDRYRLFRNQFPEVESQINQYYIAQFLGISATQLSRIRKKMFRTK